MARVLVRRMKTVTRHSLAALGKCLLTGSFVQLTISSGLATVVMEKDSAPHQQELDQRVVQQHGESLELDVRWRIQRLLEEICQLLLVVEGLSWIGLRLMNVLTGRP